MNRDSDESVEYVQHTRDAFQNSDYFINVSNNTDEIKSNIYRLIDLLFGDPFNTQEKIYETLHKTIENWPDWKKQEYNDSYTVSGYTKKLTV